MSAVRIISIVVVVIMLTGCYESLPGSKGTSYFDDGATSLFSDLTILLYDDPGRNMMGQQITFKAVDALKIEVIKHKGVLYLYAVECQTKGCHYHGSQSPRTNCECGSPRDDGGVTISNQPTIVAAYDPQTKVIMRAFARKKLAFYKYRLVRGEVSLSKVDDMKTFKYNDALMDAPDSMQVWISIVQSPDVSFVLDYLYQHADDFKKVSDALSLGNTGNDIDALGKKMYEDLNMRSNEGNRAYDNFWNQEKATPYLKGLKVSTMADKAVKLDIKTPFSTDLNLLLIKLIESQINVNSRVFRGEGTPEIPLLYTVNPPVNVTKEDAARGEQKLYDAYSELAPFLDLSVKRHIERLVQSVDQRVNFKYDQIDSFALPNGESNILEVVGTRLLKFREPAIQEAYKKIMEKYRDK